jgi:hypothetical protein
MSGLVTVQERTKGTSTSEPTQGLQVSLLVSIAKMAKQRAGCLTTSLRRKYSSTNRKDLVIILSMAHPLETIRALEPTLTKMT